MGEIDFCWGDENLVEMQSTEGGGGGGGIFYWQGDEQFFACSRRKRTCLVSDTCFD